MLKSKYFKKSEIECHCGCGQCIMDGRLIEKADLLRELCGFPIIVSSWNRCKKHNKDIGGSENSSHLRGEAIDVCCEDSKKRFILIDKALQVGFRRIGLYKDRFILHLDVDENKDQDVIWIYS